MNYVYKCDNGGCEMDQFVFYQIPVDERHEQSCPDCGSHAVLQIVPGATLVTYQTHYDEGLGMDVSGPREKQQILKALGLQEVGDKVGGARNEDKHAGVQVGRMPATGRTLSDVQRESEARREAQNAPMEVIHSNGKVDVVRPSELPSYDGPSNLNIKRDDSKMDRESAKHAISVSKQ